MAVKGIPPVYTGYPTDSVTATVTLNNMTILTGQEGAKTTGDR
jgi:hypothetical protein